MAAEVLHDGVRWRIPTGGLLVVWSAVVLGPSLAAGAAAVALEHLLPLGLAVGGVLLWALGVAQRQRPVTVRITPRAVHVDDVVLPLDELSVAKLVEPPTPDGGWKLVLRAGERVVAVGEGRPRPHLEWLLAAIDEARARFASREALEGREYSFLRKAPEQLEGIIGQSRPPTSR